MTSTDTFVSQETSMLNRAKWLLRLLAYKHESGLASDDRVVGCIYCGWQDQDYEAEPEHEEDCPIRRTRELLWSEDAPDA